MSSEAVSMSNGKGVKVGTNSLKRIREQLLMSKAELARKAGVSPLTIDRIESGKSCRMETKRKIILALGYTLDERDKIFDDLE
jgi:DNA-binding XRE family transcriptional regulator